MISRIYIPVTEGITDDVVEFQPVPRLVSGQKLTVKHTRVENYVIPNFFLSVAICPQDITLLHYILQH